MPASIGDERGRGNCWQGEPGPFEFAVRSATGRSIVAENLAHRNLAHSLELSGY